MLRIRFVDSHTGGEPTRVIVSGGPELSARSIGGKYEELLARFDSFRSAVVNEPRGSDVLVGALLAEPEDPGFEAGVVFFNNVGYLPMCGHGTIGVVETLRYLGRIGPGGVRLETLAGPVSALLHETGEVSFANVPSFRHLKEVSITLDSGQRISGDVAYGGNWFFITQDHGQELDCTRTIQLTEYAWQVREALAREGISGIDGAEIDHVELVGPSTGRADARNFVLCPGGEYDRSPCGTGTSAKLACLFADGKLAEGEEWSVESITGSVFRGWVLVVDGSVVPTVTGQAWVIADGELLIAADDPLRAGLPTPGRPR
jgi:4-hydroxyproline epimerase